jgi:hypothetical protein
MSGYIDGTVSMVLASSGSELHARVRAGNAAVVDLALAAVRDEVAATLDPVAANSRIRSANDGAEGEIEVEMSEPVSRRGLKRVAAGAERSMRRLGYVLNREVVAAGGQVVTVYARHRRARA